MGGDYDTKLYWIDNSMHIYRKSDDIKFLKKMGFDKENIKKLVDFCEKSGKRIEERY